MKRKAIKEAIKNGVITGIQSTCSTLHLGFVYGANAVEEIEVSTIKRLTGEQRLDIIKRRRTATITKQKEHKQMANDMRNSLKKFGESTHKTTMSIVHEMGVFNKVATEDVDYETVN